MRDALFAAIDDGPQAIALFDPADILAYGNTAFREAWCVAAEAFPSFGSIIRSCHAANTGTLIKTDDIDGWIAKADRLRRHGPAFRAFEVDFCDGRWFWLTERRLEGGWILSIGQDITALKNNEQTLRAARDAAVQTSLTDPLTQIANRRYALDQIGSAFAAGRRFYLALVDIDHFKRINDGFGHAIGDEILVRVAQALERLTSAGCTAARLAGDEFALLGPPDASRDQFKSILRSLAADVAEPFEVGGHAIRTGLSIGAALSFRDGENAGALLASADAAMYESKRSGRSTLRFFEAWMGQARHARSELSRDLPLAIANGELLPFYQAIVDLRTGLVRGLEALVRWRHPIRGLLSPADFAAAFRDPQLALAIDDFVLEASLRNMKVWRERGVPVAAVNVNASDSQLHRPDLVARVETALRRHNLPSECLKIEVVETAFLGREPDRVAETIAGLADLGIVCALDDFGTGHASLSHLRQFRVGRIKIDRSFVANICSDPFDRNLVKGIIELGKSIGMRITAEGVETADQLALLREFGCACAQGYLIGKPAAAEDVPSMISQWYSKFASLDAGGVEPSRSERRSRR